jgi:hypothetical protein
MNDRFLEDEKVKTEEDAIKKALQGALKRNKTYKAEVTEREKREFRRSFEDLLRHHSNSYIQALVPIADDQHCETIGNIARDLTRVFADSLVNGRLRFGTSQKALNLYLKYIWRLKGTVPPPHCPIDRIVLSAGRIADAWTKYDSKEQYMTWINLLRGKFALESLAEWEYEFWRPPRSGNVRPAVDIRSSSSVVHSRRG